MMQPCLKPKAPPPSETLFHKLKIAPRINQFASVLTIYGLDDNIASRAVKSGKDFFYVDHSYFKREWREENFRLVRKDVHLRKVIPHKEDRLSKFGVELQPWRKTGRNIVVIVPSHHLTKIYGLPDDIAVRQAEELKQYTDRPISVKKDKDKFLEAMADAWACVCPVSVAGVEAAVFGVPVFSLPSCPSYPMSAGELKDIENPEYKERYDWANSLAWACWNWNEIPTINYEAYQCES